MVGAEAVKAKVDCRYVLAACAIDYRGRDIRCPLPGHEDKNPSFGLCHNDQGFKCHGCGVGGDCIRLYALLGGISDAEAIASLARIAGVEPQNDAQNGRRGASKAKPGKKVHRTPEEAAKAAMWAAGKVEGKKYKCVRLDFYQGDDGGRFGAVARFEPVDGELDAYGKPAKTYRPIHTVAGGWQTGDPPHRKWPLFNLPAILSSSGAICVVEGEKAACAGNDLGLVCTTSAHGSKSPQKSKWTPLKDREVWIIPDADDSGEGYANLVAPLIHKAGATGIRIVRLPDLPARGDIVEFIEQRSSLSSDEVRAEIEALAANAPVWEPPEQDEAKGDSGPGAARVVPAPISSVPGIQLPEEPGKPLMWHDGGCSINQLYFASFYAASARVVFDPSLRRFYRYESDSGLWTHLTHERILVEISNIYPSIISAEIALMEHDESMDEDKKREAVFSMRTLLNRRTSSQLRSIRDLIPGSVEIRGVFDEPRRAIHVANGMVEINPKGTVSLEPFAMHHFSRNRSEIAWDPDAECPRFINELLLAAVPPEDARLIQRYLGQALLGFNLSQTILVLRGTPGGGKSTLANVIEKVIGRYNVSELRTRHLAERFEITRFVGRTLLTGKDVPGDFLNTKPAHILKALVGGDTLEGETKGNMETCPVQGVFNVLITTNTRLRVKLDADAGAWRRRLLIVDYDLPPAPKPIPEFADLLVDTEGPGILRWAVEGAVMLLSEIAEHGRIQLTDDQRRRVDDLLSESDSVRAFVRDSVVRERGADLTVSELGQAYVDYCELRDWAPLRDNQVQRELPDAMMEYHRTPRVNGIRRDGRSVRGFNGVNLCLAPETPGECSERNNLDGLDGSEKPYAHGPAEEEPTAPGDQTDMFTEGLENPSSPSTPVGATPTEGYL